MAPGERHPPQPALTGARALRIAVLTTGGTIAMRGLPGGGVAPADGAAAVAAQAPPVPGVELELHDVFAKPSASMDLADVQALADRITDALAAGCAGAVVTHGTDTLEETAFALSLMLRTNAAVVVTGAMRDPARPGADGPANLANAVRVAASPGARGRGVLAVIGDEVHAAHLVRKVHTSRVHAFSSEPFGPVGEILEDRVRIELAGLFAPPRLALPPGAAPPVVPILQVGLGLEPETVEAFGGALAAGLVVAGAGGGHVSARAVPALEALARAVPVVVTSRVAMGRALNNSYSYPGGDIDLRARGLINGGRWRPAQARILLQLAIAGGLDAPALFRDEASG